MTTIRDLLANGLVQPNDALVIKRRKVVVHGSIASDGQIEIDRGVRYNSPSAAAAAALGIGAVNGWDAWRVVRLDEIPLGTLRAGCTEIKMPRQQTSPHADGNTKTISPDEIDKAADKKLARLADKKREWESYRDWHATGAIGERPETPLLDRLDPDWIAKLHANREHAEAVRSGTVVGPPSAARRRTRRR